MQNIANELNCSNSAFVEKLEDQLYHIKWFTPNSEAPICGHATVAAAHMMYNLKMVNPDQEIIFKSLAGELIVNQNDGWVNLNFPSYPVGEIKAISELVNIVSHKPTFVGIAENRILMEFENQDALYALEPDLSALAKLNVRALIATAKADVGKYDFLSRYFAPKVGIFEDPVCASAHCSLIPYWSAKLGKKEMLVYQASKRGGELLCKDLGSRVIISGKAIQIGCLELV
jgi:PhzF family phenazine biosynthesis protein